MDNKISDELLQKQADIFKAISNKTRLKIVHLLYEKDLSVNEISGLIGNKERSGISKHLNVLRFNSIVDYKEEGTSRIYFLKARCLIEAVACTGQIIN